MRVPLEWLKEFVPVKLKAEALAERLTMAGMEVTAIEGAGEAAVLEIEITPNRPDWLSIVGVAREVAAVTGERLKLPSAKPAEAAAVRKAAAVSIAIEDRRGCPYYVGRVLTGVQIAPSPEWMQRRLTASGLRPLNNVVDITNYVLLEMGQPLHAFDVAKLQGAALRVRRAQAKEPLTTLEGKTHALTAEMLVIADAARPVAIAGVMGGQDSAVTEATRTILLESALFEPRTVRRTARQLGLKTESSYRFERGIDPEGVARASGRAAALLLELAQAQDTAVIVVGQAPKSRAAVSVHPRAVRRRLGFDISEPMLRTTLAQLGCRVASRGSGALQVSPPSFRADLLQEVDLIEEVARVGGYDRLPATLPAATLTTVRPSPSYAQGRQVRNQCVALGLTEVITWSLLAEDSLRQCRMAKEAATRLKNPLSQDQAYLRPSLLPGLLPVIRRNLTQGAAGLRLFELGNIFQPRAGACSERPALGLAVCGLWSSDWQARIPADFFRLKGLVAALADPQARGGLAWQSAALPWGMGSQGAEVHLSGRVLGAAGQVAPEVLAAWDIETPVWFAELDMAALGQDRRSSTAVQAPATVPPVKRDISFLVSAQTPYAAIVEALRTASQPLAARIELIDRYAGKPVPAGQASLTFAIEYRDPARTLTAAEADAIHQRIGQALMSRLGARLR